MRLNPAGWLHWQLSQKHLQHVHASKATDLDLVANKSDVYKRTLQVTLLGGILRGRALCAPCTRLVDCVGGTMRTPVDHSPETVGCIGILALPFLATLSLCCACMGVLDDARDGPPPAGLFCLPCEVLGQATASLTFGVKAALTGVAAGLALPPALWRAHRAACAFQPSIDDHRPGQPCVNSTTLVELLPLTEVPAAYFFRTRANLGYDVRELVAAIKARRQWQDPTSLDALCREDRVKLYRHRSGLGRALEAWMARHAHQAADISQASRDALHNLVCSLRADPEQGQAAGLAAFVHYFTHLTPAERIAIDRHMGRSGMPFQAYLEEVTRRNTCAMGFADRVAHSLARVNRTPPRYPGRLIPEAAA